MHRLIRANRVFATGRNIQYKRWSTDFPVVPIRMSGQMYLGVHQKGLRSTNE